MNAELRTGGRVVVGTDGSERAATRKDDWRTFVRAMPDAEEGADAAPAA